MAEKWYDKSIKQTEAKLSTDISVGLSHEEVKSRRKIDGMNNVYTVSKKSFSNYLRHLLTDYTSLLLVLTILFAAVFDVKFNLMPMLAILVTYYIIVMFTYVKSHRIIENMGTYALPNAKVLRGGRLYIVKQKQLVRGDIIYVSKGDIVPCDARLVETNGLEILEVNVTSVSHGVRKDASFVEYHDIAPALQKNMIFASTIVTKGTGKAICCGVGEDTLVRAMKKNVSVISNEKLKILDKISSFCKKWTLAMTVLIIILTVLDLFISTAESRGLFDSFMTGLSLAVSSMSEFYSAFAYIVLACGIFFAITKKNDINRGALIKNIEKLDAIKDLTCLVVPKEAAFNIKDMSVGKVLANGEIYSTSEYGYIQNSQRLLRYALISTGLYGAGKLIENNQHGENIYTAEEQAIISESESCGVYNIELEKRYPMIEHVSKNSDVKFDTTLVKYENRYFTVQRGDYNSVLPLCRFYTEDGRIYEMTRDKLDEFYLSAEKLAKESYRVIAIASKDTEYNDLRFVSYCHYDMTFEGFVAVKEPTLPNVAKTVSRCRNAGIKVIMISPDVSKNNEILAQSLGIIGKDNRSATGYDIANMKEGLFRANLDVYTLYQGLNLAQKRILVRYLQEQEEKVGYLCSDLDEIILMKEADVGFSHSVTISENAGLSGVDIAGRNIPVFSKHQAGNNDGGEALKFVSDVIVSEADKSGTGGFNAVCEAVASSKNIFYNLYRMMRYLISSQISKIILVFFSVFLGITALTPTQILFCGLIIDFFAVIVISFEKTGYEILRSRNNISDKLSTLMLKNIDSMLIGVFLAVTIIIENIFLNRYGLIEAHQISSCAFISYILSQIAILNECKREKSIFNSSIKMSGAYALMMAFVIGFCFLIIFVPSFAVLFEYVGLSNKVLMLSLVPAIVVTAVFEIYKLINNDGKTVKKTRNSLFSEEEF